MSIITVKPDSLFQKHASGEYILVIKSVIEKDGKYEYLLMDADKREYYAVASESYPEGKLLRCMVLFKVNKGRLGVRKIVICRGQHLITQTDKNVITQTNKKKNNRHKAKKGNPSVKLSEMAQSDRDAIVEDVKKLIKAKENGQTNVQLKNEIIRLHQIIIDGHLQDVVAERCGEESLRKVFTMARSLRRREKKKKDKQLLLGKEDSDYKKLDNKLRIQWLGWFKGKFGSIIKNKKEKDMYAAVRKAAYYLNFVELQEVCQTEDEFNKNGLVRCLKIAINFKFFNPTHLTPKRKKTTQDSYITTGSPHITRKEWGSPFRPARG